jgi:hypothetical protein
VGYEENVAESVGQTANLSYRFIIKTNCASLNTYSLRVKM